MSQTGQLGYQGDALSRRVSLRVLTWVLITALMGLAGSMPAASKPLPKPQRKLGKLVKRLYATQYALQQFPVIGRGSPSTAMSRRNTWTGYSYYGSAPPNAVNTPHLRNYGPLRRHLEAGKHRPIRRRGQRRHRRRRSPWSRNALSSFISRSSKGAFELRTIIGRSSSVVRVIVQNVSNQQDYLGRVTREPKNLIIVHAVTVKGHVITEKP